MGLGANGLQLVRINKLNKAISNRIIISITVVFDLTCKEAMSDELRSDESRGAWFLTLSFFHASLCPPGHGG